MKDEHEMSEQGWEFFRLRREQELARFKSSLAQPAMEDMPPRATRTVLPTTPIGGATINSPGAVDQAAEQNDSDLEITGSRSAEPLNAWGEDPATTLAEN